MDKVKIPVSAPLVSEVIGEPAVEDISTDAHESVQHERTQALDLIQQLKEQNAAYESELSLLKEQLSEQKSFDLLYSVLSPLPDQVAELKHEFANQAADVVIAALVKILGQSLIRPEIALAAVKEVVNGEASSQILKVMVSAKDLSLIEKYKAQLALDERIQFVEDTRVQAGGCMLELASGVVDGRIDVQLKTLHTLLKGVSQ